MKAGFSETRIEPEIGLEMAGYIDRVEKSSGIHGPLEMKTLFMGDRDPFWLVAVDLLGIPASFRPSGTVAVATHTHAAPEPGLMTGQLNSTFDISRDRARKAASPLSSIEYIAFEVEGVCSRRTGGERSSVLGGEILVLECETGRTGIVIFPCHPTVLGPENTLYSPDLAGGIRQALTRKFGFPFMYLNSCAGDVSTRYTRAGRSPDEIERLSCLFVSSMVETGRKRIIPSGTSYSEYSFEMPVKSPDEKPPFPTRPEALPGYKLALKRLESKGLEKYRSARLGMLELGEIAMLFLPFELFLDTGEILKRIAKKRFEIPLIVCYALGYLPYVVPAGMEGSYEWYASPYEERAESHLVSEVESFLLGRRLKDGQELY
jgi:hypothetical protein